MYVYMTIRIHLYMYVHVIYMDVICNNVCVHDCMYINMSMYAHIRVRIFV